MKYFFFRHRTFIAGRENSRRSRYWRSHYHGVPNGCQLISYSGSDTARQHKRNFDNWVHPVSKLDTILDH